MNAQTPNTPTLIEWDEQAFTLGVADMDATHFEFINLVNQLEEVADNHLEICRHRVE